MNDATKVETYLTHDNGGRPYQVYIDKRRSLFWVYHNYKNKVLINPTIFKSIMVGKDPSYGKFKGNSIIVEMKKNQYIYIGNQIFSFETKHPIDRYVSEVGNSDVVYAYCSDGEYMYFLIELKKVPLEKVNKKDPYESLYVEGAEKYASKIKTKILVKREF